MRRQVLIATIACGSVLTALSGLGLFAALTDTVNAPGNSATSKGLQSSADLQFANLAGFPASTGCSAWTEDAETPLITMTDADLGSGFNSLFCLRNVGSAPVDVTMAVDTLTSSDTGCTGDEAEYDTSCGLDPLGTPQVGELDQVLMLYTNEIDCTVGGGGSLGWGTLAELAAAATPLSFNSIDPGETKCYAVFAEYPTTTTNVPRQQAQSDSTTWRLQFVGNA